MSELTREDLLARECGALNGKLAGYAQVNERLEKELITFNRIIERLEKERDALKRQLAQCRREALLEALHAATDLDDPIEYIRKLIEEGGT